MDVLPGNGEYDLGYDYHECGIVKLCKDEGCPEYAKYLCRLDFLLADIMGMELKRTGLFGNRYGKKEYEKLLFLCGRNTEQGKKE